MILKDENLVVRIPERPNRYRANCSKEWGVFVHESVGKLNYAKAEKAGLIYDSFVEMALCWVNQRVLSFKPHYVNEHFVEIWGIPTDGKMKTSFAPLASELCKFLMHRQSKDKFNSITDIFRKDAFNEWAQTDMETNADEFIENKIGEYYFNNIFRFEFVEAKSMDYGAYFYIQTSYRAPKTELEKSALNMAKQLYSNAKEYCNDPLTEDNNSKCLSEINVNALPEGDNINVNGKTNDKVTIPKKK